MFLLSHAKLPGYTKQLILEVALGDAQNLRCGGQVEKNYMEAS